MLIIITGASKGIGFEAVRQFSTQPEALIIAISRDITSLKTFVKNSNIHSVLPLKADVTKMTDIKKIHALVKTLNIPLDILIHNAGQIVNKAFEKISEKELKAVYATNVFGPFLLTQSLIPLFNKKQRAHIVNIGSMGGFQGSTKFAGLSAYSSSKTALSGLTECLAEELKSKNISVNCLALGAVQTEMLSKAFPGYKAPMKPKQMAEFVCHFALNGHSFFNGKILPVASTTP